MKAQIDKLNKERNQLLEHLDEIDDMTEAFRNDAVEALRTICTHRDRYGTNAMKAVRTDSHKTHYECTICGETLLS